MFCADKKVELYCNIIRMQSPVNGTILNLKDGPLTTAQGCPKTSRTSVGIESNKTLFQYSAGEVRTHATPEAIMKALMDYSTVFRTFTITRNVRIRRTDLERQPARKN